MDTTMAKASKERLTLKVSIAGQTDYDGPIIAYSFKPDGAFVARSPVKNGQVTLPFDEAQARKHQVFFGPEIEDDETPSITTLRRISAFEASLSPGQLVDRVILPGEILTHWPLCFCWVTGRVLREGRPVCDAIVHICEVDAIYWIYELLDRDLFRLRDDLIAQLRRPSGLDEVAFNPQPDPPALMLEQDSPFRTLPNDVLAGLTSASPTVLRSTLIDRFQLFYPYLCLTPLWWRYRCDHLGTRTTDANGRFSMLLPYNCLGDRPDIYVWVEYPINGTDETVYRPPVRCNTYWNYQCGSDIVVNITDPRVPTCDPEGDPDGCLVNVLSIGRTVSVSEVGSDGLLAGGNPFGGTLEPRVDFSRTDLIDKGITHYRWRYRRLTGPDGTTPDVGTWQDLSRDVYRHYRVFSGGILSYPSERLGPDAAGPAPNTIRIKPPAPPAPGIEWVTTNERVDLASGYFETRSLAGAPATRADGDDTSAGLYELRLELFDGGSATPIEFEPNGVFLKIADIPAPFPTGTITTIDAPESHRIRNGSGNTVAFRMVLRVDNNFCDAEVFAASGSATTCGIIKADGSSTVELGFRARHPNGFANYSHTLERGDGLAVPVAATSGQAGAPDANGFAQAPPFEYRRSFVASSLLGTCPQAAFAEVIDVDALATDGYSRMSGYDQTDVGAFALVTPCAPCDCDDTLG